jgi:Recombinase
VSSAYASIAAMLNAESAPSPRSRKDPTSKWSAGSVRELINRPLYCGEIVWGKTKKRNIEGKVDPTKGPASEWIHIRRPELEPDARVSAGDAPPAPSRHSGRVGASPYRLGTAAKHSRTTPSRYWNHRRAAAANGLTRRVCGIATAVASISAVSPSRDGRRSAHALRFAKALSVAMSDQRAVERALLSRLSIDQLEALAKESQSVIDTARAMAEANRRSGTRRNDTLSPSSGT